MTVTLDSSETLLQSKEKNEKREPDLAPQTINVENRYAYDVRMFRLVLRVRHLVTSSLKDKSSTFSDV